MNRSKFNLSRRDVLRMGAGTLLSMGIWPGALRAADAGLGGRFSFIAVNDFHYIDDKAVPFLERAFALMKSGDATPELCLMSGDFSEHGTKEELNAIRDLIKGLGFPTYGVVGNHDCVTQTDRKPYEEVFPNRINYSFEHRDWQIVCLDTTEGLRASRTNISDTTLRWIDDALPKLDKKRPMIVVSHFPLGPGVANRPVNADAVLEKFLDYNLQAAFCGHWHGQSERQVRQAVVTTDRCCSFSAKNHDGSKEKGFFLCQAAEGRVTRKFLEVS
jgi:calcineurin-like phosphoesterase family protein